MSPSTIQRVVRRYGLNPAELLPAQKGYRNTSYPLLLGDGRSANLILYKHEPGIVATIRRINHVTTFASRHGSLPVRLSFDGRITRLETSHGSRYAALYTYLPGATIAWEAYGQRHMKLLGASLSDLHAALRTYPTEGLPRVGEYYATLFTRMRRYFADSSVRSAIKIKLALTVPDGSLNEALQLLRASERLSRKQALHMDFVRSNILFEGAGERLHISGILDFEKTAVGHPLFDIARTLAFLLVDCKYKSEAQVRKYFLDSGYRKRGHQSYVPVMVRHKDTTAPLLELLINVFLLHDLYKFLKHTPYESLCANEHYLRTRDYLCRRGVITTTHTV